MTKRLKKIQSNIKSVIPGYATGLLICMLGINLFTYSITPFWTNKLYHYSLMTSFDLIIPFKSIFVIPYILAYIQWIVGYLLIARTDEAYCTRILTGEIVAKIIVCIIYILIPTTMERATITDSGICSYFVRLIYSLDQPINLFPSIHCLESWICFRGSINKLYFSKKYMVIMGVSTISVMLSTVFIKQHVVLDAIGAIIVGEVGLLIGKRKNK